MSKKICRLSCDELQAIRNGGEVKHKNHLHCGVRKALELIETDNAYALEDDIGIDAIVEFRSNGYVWKTRPSSGFAVRQMVRLVQG